MNPGFIARGNSGDQCDNYGLKVLSARVLVVNLILQVESRVISRGGENDIRFMNFGGSITVDVLEPLDVAVNEAVIGAFKMANSTSA